MHISGAFEPVAVTTRSGRQESVHFGAAALVDADGAIIASVGDPTVAVYPRSASKPLQADAMFRLGVALSLVQLAAACSSHDGTPAALAVVKSTLTDAGIDEALLANTPSLPLDLSAAEALLAAGGRRSTLAMTCSGKHAAMLATCVSNGWTTDDYLALDHPLQQAISDHVEHLAGPVFHVGVDGCGAPSHMIGLDRLAVAYGTLATSQSQVYSAVTSYPDLVGGGHPDTPRLMRAIPGAMVKDGVEGLFVAALPDGRAAAVKIADGASRAAGVVLAAVLAHAGIDVDPADFGEPVLGHGRPVGRVEPIFEKLA